jgi:hypothetical protein
VRALFSERLAFLWIGLTCAPFKKVDTGQVDQHWYCGILFVIRSVIPFSVYPVNLIPTECTFELNRGHGNIYQSFSYGRRIPRRRCLSLTKKTIYYLDDNPRKFERRGTLNVLKQNIHIIPLVAAIHFALTIKRVQYTSIIIRTDILYASRRLKWTTISLLNNQHSHYRIP